MNPALPMMVLAASLPGGPQVPPFTDQTTASGLSFTHASAAPDAERYLMTPGVAAADFDRDGWMDLFVPGGLGQNARLFMNNQDGTFTDRAAEWNIDLVDVEGASVTAGDIDGDGDIDLYVGTVGGSNRVLVNFSTILFFDAGTSRGAVLVGGVPFDAFGAAFGDTDLDGDLDLVTAQWTYDLFVDGNRLFANQGGTFVDSTASAGAYAAPDPILAFTPALVDLDGDRAPELVVAADFGTSTYHANDGDGTFTWLQETATCTDENGMGSALADYDNDGDLDWFVTSIHDDDQEPEGNWGVSGNRLYRNDGDHVFTDVTDQAGVRDGDWGWGAGFGDFNHDGLLDLVMTNGWPHPSEPAFHEDPSRLWLGTGDFDDGPAFVEASAEAGVTHTGQGRGLVIFDADNDGDLDIAITTNRGELAFYRNGLDPDPGTWIEVDLAPPAGCAPDGVGATIEVSAGGQSRHRVVGATTSFMSQHPIRAHFGFPAAAVIEQITVNWPDGAASRVLDAAPGQVLRIRFADLDGDGLVGITDFLEVLGTWGTVGAPADFLAPPGVGVEDFLALLSNWGS